MITIGIRGKKTLTVTDNLTAKAVGSGGLAVFATPSLVALMEATAMESLLPVLAAGEGTVGTAIAVKHTAATPVGMAVRCESELIAVDGRRLTFHIAAYDDAGPIGTAEHERFVIDNERFMQKAEGKRTR